MERRALLAVLGTGLLAGCSSGGSDGGGGETGSTTTAEPAITTHSGPANFADVELTGPESAEVGDEVEFTVGASNTGGDTGDFTATVTAGTGVFTTDQSVTIEDVPPGERDQTSFGPFTITRARDYTLRITDYGAEHTVTGKTRAVDGNAANIGDSRIRVDSVDAAARIVTDTGVAVPENDVLLIATFSVSGDRTPSVDSFRINGSSPVGFGPGYSETRFGSESWSVYNDDEGGGSIVWDLPATTVTEGADLTVNMEYENPGPPEVEFALDPLSVPKLSADVSIADSVKLTDSGGVTISATNTGDADAVYKGKIIRTSTLDETSGEVITVPVPAGESVEISKPLSAQAVGEIEFQVVPDTEPKVVQVEAGELETGQSYTGNTGLRVTVEDISPWFREFEYRDSDGQTHTIERVVVFIEATFENTTDEELTVPSTYGFGPEEGRTVYHPDPVEYISPSYDRLPLSTTIPAGESYSGAVPFKGTGENVVVVWNAGEFVSAPVKWTESAPQN